MSRRAGHNDRSTGSRGGLAADQAACPPHAGDRAAGRRAGRRRSARAQARIAAAQRLVQGPRCVSQAAREPGPRSRHRRRIGRQPRRGRGLCRACARAQGRDLRPDRRLADQGRAPQELWRGRPSGRGGLCRGAGAVGEARGGDRCVDRAGLRGRGRVRGRGLASRWNSPSRRRSTRCWSRSAAAG